jgi:soluble lytic murein transglycosylase
VRRRRLAAVLVAAVLGAVVAAVAVGVGGLGDQLREITLPLRHDDIIRQQAADKDLDPALIAAVIYEESRFRDQTSHAGARGLMQITPDTAQFIARNSGGIRFVQEDLATPQINIAYGSYYLRYLLDRYDGNETLAIAAYNAGHGNVDRWVASAGGPDKFDAVKDIPFPETRSYVAAVLKTRDDYRQHYADDLGL